MFILGFQAPAQFFAVVKKIILRYAEPPRYQIYACATLSKTP